MWPFMLIYFWRSSRIRLRLTGEDETETKYMQWYTYFLLLIVYVIYLAFGAVVFQAIEQPAEIAKCDQAKLELKDKIAQFGDEYFYTLGLNKKFCNGIRLFLANETLSGSYKPFIRNIVNDWKSNDCDQPSYVDLIAALESKSGDDETMSEYANAWGQIQALAEMEPEFDNETIIISGKTLRMIMKKTAHFGVNNYLRLQTDCHEKWNYHNAFFFAGTLATTIGYGNNAPETKTGKIFCLVFILIGIPYFAYMMSVISDLINGKMDQLRKLIERNTTKMVPCYFIPIIYTIIGFIFLIVVPSIIFTIMEDWDIVDAVYYSFISLSTIGFGDFVPRNDPPTKYADYVRNDTACFEELINPIPSKEVNLQSGLTKLCNPTIWPEKIEAVFNMYRVGVFFWILAGLVWLGGVISIITELIRARGNLKSQETAKNDMTDNRIESFSSINKEINFGPSEDGSVDSKFYNNGALKNEYINGIHNGVTQWNPPNFS